MGLSQFSTIHQLYQKNILQDMIGLVFAHICFVHKLTAISKIISNQSFILRHLPPQIKEDPGFMAVLNVAFTTLATCYSCRNKVEYEVHLHEEKLSHGVSAPKCTHPAFKQSTIKSACVRLWNSKVNLCPHS